MRPHEAAQLDYILSLPVVDSLPRTVEALRQEGRALLVARSGMFDDGLTFSLVCRWREAYAAMNGQPLYMEKERGELDVTLVWLTTQEPACWAVKEPEGRDVLPYLRDRRADWEALHRVLERHREEVHAVYAEWNALLPSYGRRTAQHRRDFNRALSQAESKMEVHPRVVLWFFEDRHGLERGWEPWEQPKTKDAKP